MADIKCRAAEGLLQYIEKKKNEGAIPDGAFAVEASHLFSVSPSEIMSALSFRSDVNGLPAEEIMDPNIRAEGMLLGKKAYVPWLALEKAKEDKEMCLSEIEASALTGRGGAGYPVHLKWKAVKEAEGTEKTVICNVSEGEMGTCKDLALIMKNAEAVVEGLAICAVITGAGEGIFYVRCGYEAAADKLRAVIAANNDKLGTLKLSVVVNGGTYVCGEETGLIESLEGKRGEARRKPPYPAENGYLGTPTVINNAETLANVPYVLTLGAEEYKKRETRLFTVTGCGCSEGVYELEAASTVEKIIDAAKPAQAAMAALVGGGSSGVFVPGEEFTAPLAGSIGAGSIRFVESKAEILYICRSIARFYANESCGKCTPCRYGTKKITELLENDNVNMEELTRLCEYTGACSFCGLGKTAGNALGSALRLFPDAFRKGGAEK